MTTVDSDRLKWRGGRGGDRKFIHRIGTLMLLYNIWRMCSQGLFFRGGRLRFELVFKDIYIYHHQQLDDEIHIY